jgi:hypothetical protein
MQVTGVEFPELIAEGNTAMLRSVEKFNASFGFKFSTYACRAIPSCFRLLSDKARRQRERFPVGFDARLEKSDQYERHHEDDQGYAIEAVLKVLLDNRAELSAMERWVMLERFGGHFCTSLCVLLYNEPDVPPAKENHLVQDLREEARHMRLFDRVQARRPPSAASRFLREHALVRQAPAA